MKQARALARAHVRALTTTTTTAAAAAAAAGVAAAAPPARKPRSVVLEVERKFRSAAAAQLRLNSGKPAFDPFSYRGAHRFHDTYYDDGDWGGPTAAGGTLVAAGVWLRCRDQRWQAKVRLGGDFNRSEFEELDDVPAIGRLVQRLRGRAPMQTETEMLMPPFGLRPTASFATVRETWSVGGRTAATSASASTSTSTSTDPDDDNDDAAKHPAFEIVLDTTDFGHVVGEIELVRMLERGADGEEDEQEEGEEGEEEESLVARRHVALRQMNARLDAFMERHAWAFPPGKPVGKLSAYFEWKAKEGTLPLASSSEEQER
ncbi:MAG: hypothetical protein M1826_007225 [Phylliscum demangeonii]|nr:MAG: hypothetical protein M1826_007225 [Phylliscum demangeonii]